MHSPYTYWAEFGHKFSQLSKEITHSQVRERPLMMYDFRGRGGSKMTPQNRTLEGKNRTLGGKEGGGSKMTKKISNIIYGCSLKLQFCKA